MERQNNICVVHIINYKKDVATIYYSNIFLTNIQNSIKLVYNIKQCYQLNHSTVTDFAKFLGLSGLNPKLSHTLSANI